MFYRFKHRFLTGWLRLLYSLRIKWKIYYASHLAQIVIWFFQIRILLLLHSPISSHANFIVFPSKSVPRFSHEKFRHLRTPLQRKYQSAHAQKNISITTKLHRGFFYRERCYFTRFPFLGYGILAGHPRCWRQTDVPALNSKQKSKQNLYYAHGAEYIANVCWWLWWTGHLFLAMQDWTTRGCHYVQRQWELLKSSVVLHRVPTYGGRWHSGRGMVL